MGNAYAQPLTPVNSYLVSGVIVPASALDPAWIAAASAAIGGVIALRIVIHWCMIRRVFRGSGGAIIALLGESACEVMRPSGQGAAGRISYESETAYFEVGADRYMLCARDLERLRGEGYISLVGTKYQLSRLGRLLLERYDNGRLLAKSVARARRPDRSHCAGGHYLRCRCARYRYWVAGRQVPVPYFLAKKLEAREFAR